MRRIVIAFWLIVLSMIAASSHAARHATAAEPPALCEEPEAKLLDRPTVRFEHWPLADAKGAGMSVNGTYLLTPQAPARPAAFCAWGAATPSGHQVELTLETNAFGKGVFHLRVWKPDGTLVAEGERAAKLPLYGYWQFIGREEEYRQPDPLSDVWEEVILPTFQPGSVLLAERPELAGATASLINPPHHIARKMTTGEGVLLWNEVFSLDEVSRRYLLQVGKQALQSPNADVRARAVETLGAMGTLGKEAVPALVQALKDTGADNLVAAYAANALLALGAAAAPAVPQLTRTLTHQDQWVRAPAAWALAFIGPPAREAVPALVKTMRDENKQARLGAATALGAIGQADESVERALVAALADREYHVRAYAARALGRLDRAADRAIAAMVELLDNTHAGDLRTMAARALGLFGPTTAPPLIRALGNSALHIRESAYDALMMINTPEAIGAAADYDATELSPRFWTRLEQLVNKAGQERVALAPMLARLNNNVLRWLPAHCTASSGPFILYQEPELATQVADLRMAGTAPPAPGQERASRPSAEVTVLGRKGDAVHLRVGEAIEGWAKRASFACSGLLVTDRDGNIIADLFPKPKILQRERTVRFVLVDAKPHLYFNRMDAAGGIHPGFAFELNPLTLEIVDVRMYDDLAEPLQSENLPPSFPINFFLCGYRCNGCFEAGGRVFLNC